MEKDAEPREASIPVRKIVVPIARTGGGRDLPLPEYASEGAAGLDLRAAVASEVVIQPLQRAIIPTGIRVSLPDGYEAQVRPRSGLAADYGITLLNSPGTVDSDYRGEISVIVINLGDRPFTIKRGDRIAQLVVGPVARVEWSLQSELDETPRSSGGFGHTGRA